MGVIQRQFLHSSLCVRGCVSMSRFEDNFRELIICTEERSQSNPELAHMGSLAIQLVLGTPSLVFRGWYC